MSSFSNPFRSAAQMVPEGTIRRPAYLDGDGELAAMTGAPTMHVVVERPHPQAVTETSPVAAAAVARPAAADERMRVRSADRGGRLLH